MTPNKDECIRYQIERMKRVRDWKDEQIKAKFKPSYESVDCAECEMECEYREEHKPYYCPIVEGDVE